MNHGLHLPAARARLSALAILLVFVAGGCAAPGPAPGPMPPTGPVKRVGIVSLIGDRVQWSYFGVASWDNRAASISAADWELDAAATRAAERGVAPGIAAVALTPSRRLRVAVNTPLDLQGWYGTGNAEVVLAALGPIIAGKDLDVVIVLRRIFGDDDTATDTRVNGVGVISREGRPGEANVYAWITVFAYDLRARRGINEVTIRVGGPAPGGRMLPLAALPSDLSAALQAHRVPLRDAFTGMFDESLPPAIRQLGLQ